jgi:hypothetical protein
MITVQVRPGTVARFPDGTKEADIQEAVAREFPPTGEDIDRWVTEDPDFTPTQQQFESYAEFAKTKPVDWMETVMSAVPMLAGRLGDAVAAGVGEGAALNPLNWAEALGQGNRALIGMAVESANPNSPAFRFRNWLMNDGDPKARYMQFLEARAFNKQTLDLEAGKDTTIAPLGTTNPKFTTGASDLLDLSAIIPASKLSLAARIGSRTVGTAAKAAGHAVAGIARPIEAGLHAAGDAVTATLGVAPETLRTAAVGVGAGGVAAGAPGLAAIAAAPALATKVRQAGEVLAEAGQGLISQPSRIGPLERIGILPNASKMDKVIGAAGRAGGDALLQGGLRAAAGAVEGAVIGGGLGYYAGGEEGAAAGIGTGGLLGAGGATLARGIDLATGSAAREARLGDLGRHIASLPDAEKARWERLVQTNGPDVASTVMDGVALARGTLGDMGVNLLTADEFKAKHGDIARGVETVVGDTPTIDLNIDVLGKDTDTVAYTLGHELFHGFDQADQLKGKVDSVRAAISGQWVRNGDTGVLTKISDGLLTDADIEARFAEYRAKAPKATADEMGKMGDIKAKADFIVDELAGEYLGRLIAGGNPDALLRGFGGNRQLLDYMLLRRAGGMLDRAAERLGGLGARSVDSVLFPGLKEASPLLNAMLRDLVRARRALDKRIEVVTEGRGLEVRSQDLKVPDLAQRAVDAGFAEKDATTGAVQWRTVADDKVQGERQRQAILDAVTKTPGDARVVDGKVQGRFSPEQLDAIAASMRVPNKVVEMLRAFSESMRTGRVLEVEYGKATTKKQMRNGKYKSVYSTMGLRRRMLTVYNILTNEDGALYARILDVSQLDSVAADRAARGALGPWGKDAVGFVRDFERYAQNLGAIEPPHTSTLFGGDKAKAEFLHDFLLSQEKGGSRLIRSFRLDRVTETRDTGRTMPMGESVWTQARMRWMPAEKVGENVSTTSNSEWSILRSPSGNSRLYAPSGELHGVYKTQAEAEAAANADRIPGNPSHSVEVVKDMFPGADEAATRAMSNIEPVPQESMARFMPADQAEIARYNEILATMPGKLAIIPPSRGAIVIREGVLNTPPISGRRRERLDKVYRAIDSGGASVRVGALVEGGETEMGIPKTLRGLEPKVFVNVPITQTDLRRPRPADWNKPMVVTGNPHLVDFVRPHPSWDQFIKVVRIKPVHRGNARVNAAVASAINYANEIGARILVTTFRSLGAWAAARYTDVLPIDPKHPEFSKYWTPNKDPRPTDPKRIPDWSPFRPTQAAIEKLKESGWMTQKARYGKGTSAWYWPSSSKIHPEIAANVSPDTRLEFCDLLHKGCTACRNCQKLTYPEAHDAPVWGLTDEPFCDHACPNCFVRQGQSGVKGRKGISLGQNAKQGGFGQPDLGDTFKQTIDTLQAAVRGPGRDAWIDDVREFFRLPAEEQEKMIANLMHDGRITDAQADAALSEIRGVDTAPATQAKRFMPVDWDEFRERLSDDLDSYYPARNTGQRDYDTLDLVDRFIDYASKAPEGTAMPALIKGYDDMDASKAKVRRLKKTLAEIAPPIPAP